MSEDQVDRIKSHSAKQENVTSFIADFNQMKQAIEKKLEQIENTDNKDDIRKQFDLILSDYDALLKFLSNSTFFLPSFNVKVAQDSLKSLSDDIASKREIMLPKKKFGFKKNNSPKALKQEKSYDTVDSSAKSSELLNQIDAAFYGLKDLNGVTINLKANDVNARDVNLVDLNNCEVKIFGTPNTLHIKNATHSRIYCGPVMTSIFVSDCSESSFHLACQQLRIHTTKSCAFSIHVTSRCVIEDCSQLLFSPFDWNYDGIDNDFDSSKLDRETNNWDKVCDFNWLVADKPSPNWHIACN